MRCCLLDIGGLMQVSASKVQAAQAYILVFNYIGT